MNVRHLKLLLYCFHLNFPKLHLPIELPVNDIDSQLDNLTDFLLEFFRDYSEEFVLQVIKVAYAPPKHELCEKEYNEAFYFLVFFEYFSRKRNRGFLQQG